MSSPEKFYVTTPIYYVNARPHIGHAYTTVVADVVARRHRLLGDDTFFLTGTDEHGQKIERSAAAAGIPPQQFADGVSQSFRDLWRRMGITYNKEVGSSRSEAGFIRTTDPEHKLGVQKLFAELFVRGEIYLSSYTGQYSVGEEMFVEGPPGTIGPDGRPTETVTEENFFFRLSKYQLPLLDLIESGTLNIQPDSRRNEVLSFLRGNLPASTPGAPGLASETWADAPQTAREAPPLAYTAAGTPYVPGALKDLSVSRSSFTWGIPVPEPAASLTEQPHVIYVWLDALANYMTALGYGSEDESRFHEFWPADLHLVGKEIIRFHCVYWPAFLLALNPTPAPAAPTAGTGPASPFPEPASSRPEAAGRSGETPALAFDPAWAAKMLPKSVVAHGWLLFEESKMSKSRGNIVRTETILDGFGDHYRRELLRLGQPEPTKADADLFASDVLRYFLLREIPFGQDGSFSFDAMITRYNADLANGYGNLVSRTLNLVVKTSGGTIENCLEANSLVFYMPPLLETHNHTAQVELLSASECQALGWRMAEVARLVPEQLSAHSFAEAMTTIASAVSAVDQLMTSRKPWAATETELSQQGRRSTLYTAAESIRILTALLYPILPYSTAKVWAQLGLGSIEDAAREGKLKDLQWGGLSPGTRLGPLTPIFPRAPKELAQIMSDSETKPSLTAVTADNDAATSERTEFREAPLSDAAPSATTPGAPGLASETWVDAAQPPKQATLQPSTQPGAPPRTASLPHHNPGAQVGASSAPAVVLPRTTSHVDAEPSGVFAGTVAASPITAAPATAAPQITIDDFAKVELRVAKILVAERIPKADKLLRLEVDLGPELGQRQILSGIAEWYPPETLIGRTIVVITNLAPRKMRGLESHGMLLAASAGENGKPILATFGEDIAPGTRLK